MRIRSHATLYLLFFGLGMMSAFAESSHVQLSAVAAARFLEQASWGPTPDAVAHLQQTGFDRWLEEQVAAPTSPVSDAPAETKGLKNLQQQFFVNAVNGPDQLRQRVAFALSEIWVVSGVKINDPAAMVAYLRLLQKDAFGNYFDLMKDITINPTMGHYLDLVNNDKPDPAAGKSANENYARELLQLFTVGEVILNSDGTPKLDKNGKIIPTYSESTVQNFARVFTGWTYPPKPGAASHKHNPPNWDSPMVEDNDNHDQLTKTLLNGKVMPAGRSAKADLNGALQNIFTHHNLGPFISRQLIQHLVVSNPSLDYVARIASVFADNGSGVRGDLRAVIRAIILDAEARASDDAAIAEGIGGHLREPLLFITALLRALNGSVNDTNNLAAYSSAMGQNLYYPASVFSYFSPNYHLAGSRLLAPEFQTYSTATSLTRANFVNALVFGHIDATTHIDLSPYISAASNPGDLLTAVNKDFLYGRMPAQMQQSILTALGSAQTARLKAQTAVYLVASSPLYQVAH
jgi:uncharacterized protein (DUF1800 family)